MDLRFSRISLYVSNCRPFRYVKGCRARITTLLAVIALVTVAAACGDIAEAARPTLTHTHAAKTWTFSDDFNGTKLDTSKWSNGWGGDGIHPTKPVNGSMTDCDDPANVHEAGGYLDLRMTNQSCTVNGHTYAYRGSTITTYGKESFSNFTLTARVFLDGDARGIFGWVGMPWTDGLGTWPQTGESDVAESLGGKACFTVHTSAGASSSLCRAPMVGWHRIREVVKNGASTVYYDGVLVGTHQNAASPQMIAFDVDAGPYGGNLVTPADELIDWVHVKATT